MYTTLMKMIAGLILFFLLYLRTLSQSPPDPSLYDISPIQITALSSLFNSTQGPFWAWRENKAKFGIPWDFSKVTVNPCYDRWQGIVCSCNISSDIVAYPYYYEYNTFPPNTFPCTVTHLDLINMHLNGTLPSSISLLNNLTYLHVSQNLLYGSIPSSIGELTQLAVIDLCVNQFTGHLPDSLFNLGKSLIVFSMEDNRFSGPLPSLFGRLSALQSIFLRLNYFTGPIPASFGNLTSLSYLSLKSNALTGPIPTELSLLSSTLQLINIGYNHITGPLPSQLSTLRHMYSLQVGPNHLTGTIPPSLCSLPSLSNFWIYANQFHGSFPSLCSQSHSLSSLMMHQNFLTSGGPLNSFSFINSSAQKRLAMLDISFNSFSGTLAPEIFLLPKLRSFIAVSNCLQGSFPSSICRATQLQELILDGLTSGASCLVSPWKGNPWGFNGAFPRTLMSGSIPACIFNSFHHLYLLSLSGNGFTGSLSSVVSVPPKLRNLTLSYNLLTGPLPPVLLYNNSLLNIDLSYNRFNGVVGDLACKTCQFPNSSRLLQVNRFSGPIPPSFHSSPSVAMLNGNLFGSNCPWAPLHDPYYLQFVCGSDRFNFILLVGATLILPVVLCYFISSLVWRSTGAKTKENDEDGSSLVLSSSSTPPVSPIYSSFLLIHSWTHFGTVEEPSGLSLLVPDYLKTDDLSEDSPLNHSLLLMRFYHAFRRSSLLITSIALVVFFVIYSILSYYFPTHSYAYIWFFSSAYLSGSTPTIILSLAWTLALIALLLGAKRTLVNPNDLYHNRQSPFRTVSVSSSRYFHSLSLIPENMRLLFTREIAVQSLRATTLYLFNFLVVMAVNILYVQVNQSSSYTRAFLLLLKLLLVFFKIGWNRLVLPVLSEETLTLRGLTTLFMVNTVILPALAVLIGSSVCFNPLFISPEAIKSFTNFQHCPPGVNCNKVLSVETSYPAPFIYTFSCSSELLINYSGVFLLMSINLFLFEALRFCVIFLRLRILSLERERAADPNPPYSLLSQIRKWLLPLLDSLTPLAFLTSCPEDAALFAYRMRKRKKREDKKKNKLASREESSSTSSSTSTSQNLSPIHLSSSSSSPSPSRLTVSNVNRLTLTPSPLSPLGQYNISPLQSHSLSETHRLDSVSSAASSASYHSSATAQSLPSTRSRADTVLEMFDTKIRDLFSEDSRQAVVHLMTRKERVLDLEIQIASIKNQQIVLMTFGLCFPPLGLVVGLVIWLRLTVQQALIGRILSHYRPSPEHSPSLPLMPSVPRIKVLPRSEAPEGTEGDESSRTQPNESPLQANYSEQHLASLVELSSFSSPSPSFSSPSPSISSPSPSISSPNFFLSSHMNQLCDLLLLEGKEASEQWLSFHLIKWNQILFCAFFYSLFLFDIAGDSRASLLDGLWAMMALNGFAWGLRLIDYLKFHFFISNKYSFQ